MLITALTFSQNLKRVAAYDNNYNSNSGIFGITDNSVYEYSWYYSAWLQLPVNGLPVVEGETKIDEISAFDNNSLNPSGVYVIADTAVFVYNYYAETWYHLNNAGLCRVGGVVQLSDLSAHLEVDSDYERIYVISCENVFYYNRYAQNWTSLSNDGIEASKTELNAKEIETMVYPNPISINSVISFVLPDNYLGDLKITVFDESGKIMKELVNEYYTGGRHEVDLSGSDLKSGVYFYEILGNEYSKAKSFVKL